MKLAIIRLRWALMRAWLRWKGVEVGRGVTCNGFPAIRIRPGGRIVLGDGVAINCSRRSNPLNVEGATSLYAGPGASLTIEAGAGISGSQIIAHAEVVIGEGSLVGAGCLICDSDMHEVPLGSGRPIVSTPIRIGRNVFVGARCIILKGVSIGDGSVIAGGSVVIKRVDEHVLVAGNPARLVKEWKPS